MSRTDTAAHTVCWSVDFQGPQGRKKERKEGREKGKGKRKRKRKRKIKQFSFLENTQTTKGIKQPYGVGESLLSLSPSKKEVKGEKGSP